MFWLKMFIHRLFAHNAYTMLPGGKYECQDCKIVVPEPTISFWDVEIN
jgi:hypothetical protein